MICIYHRIDADGVASAALVKLYADSISKPFTGMGYNYGDTIDVSTIIDQDVFVVDCCLTESQMAHLYEKNRLTWIDHHISAIDKAVYKNYAKSDGIRCTAFAACELVHRHLMHLGFNVRIKYELLNSIGLYDCFAGMKCESIKDELFQFTLGVRALNVLNINDMIAFLEGRSLTYTACVNNGDIVEQYLLGEYTKVWNNAEVKCITEGNEQYKALYYKGDRINLYNYFDKDEISVDILICENVMGDGSVSLYSNTIDVSEIAINHGGGGHKGASGIPKSGVRTFLSIYVKDWKAVNEPVTISPASSDSEVLL